MTNSNMALSKTHSLATKAAMIALPFVAVAFSLLLIGSNQRLNTKHTFYTAEVALNIKTNSTQLGASLNLFVQTGQKNHLIDIIKNAQIVEYSVHALKNGGIAKVGKNDEPVEPAGSWIDNFYHSFIKSWTFIRKNIDMMETADFYLSDSTINPLIINSQNLISIEIENSIRILDDLIEQANFQNRNHEILAKWINISHFVNILTFFLILYLKFITSTQFHILELAKKTEHHKENNHDWSLTIPIKELERLKNGIVSMLDNLSHSSERILATVGQKQGKKVDISHALNLLEHEIGKQNQKNLEQLEKERVEKWQTDGLAHFDALQRKHGTELSSYARTLLKEMTRFFHALQGGIFLLENNQLRQIAFFAYDRERMAQLVLPATEGLLARALQEGQHVHLSELPEGYLKVSSGLGERMPSQLLIIPMIEEKVAVGVVELASFEAFTPDEIAFAQVLSNNAATVLQNLRTASLKQALLETAQANQERLQNQEEELRQNLEELQATQETLSLKDLQQQETIEQLNEENERRLADAMRAKQQAEQSRAEMQGIINALETNTWVAQYKPDGTAINLNKLAINKLGLESGQVHGLSHSSLFPRFPAGPEFWHPIRLGESQRLIHETLVDGKSIWLSESFTPVWGNSGHVEKVLALGQEITELKALEQFLEKSKSELEHAQADLAQKETMLEEALQEIELSQEEMQEQQNALLASQKKSRIQIKELREKVKALESELAKCKGED